MVFLPLITASTQAQHDVENGTVSIALDRNHQNPQVTLKNRNPRGTGAEAVVRLEGRLIKTSYGSNWIKVQTEHPGQREAHIFTLDKTSNRVAIESQTLFESKHPKVTQIADVIETKTAILNGRREPGQTVTLSKEVVIVAGHNDFPMSVRATRTGATFGYHSPRQSASSASVPRLVPRFVSMTYSVFLGNNSEEEAQKFSWAHFGRAQLFDPYPQPLPFLYLTPYVYNFGETEEEERAGGEEEEQEKKNGPWWSEEGQGQDIGAPREPGLVMFNDFANSMRAAWGMKWWGEKVGHPEWKEHAEQLFNLMLSAPHDDKGMASEFNVKTKTWGPGSDRSAQAVNAYWALRWIEKWQDEEVVEKSEDLIERELDLCASVFRANQSPADLERGLVALELGFLERCSKSSALSDRARISAKKILDDRAEWLATLSPQLQKRAAASLKLSDPSFAEYEIERHSPHVIEALPWSIDDLDYNEICLCEKGRLAVAYMRAGDQTGRQDIFERGVARLREQIGYLADPTLTVAGAPAPNLKLGRASTHRDVFGDFGPWQGFEHSEGQVMASLAEALDEFGGFFEHRSGWKVGIDAVVPDRAGDPVSLLTRNPRPFNGKHEVEIVGPHERRVVTAQVKPVINLFGLKSSGQGLTVFAIPFGKSANSDNSGKFRASGGSWSAAARLGTTAFEAPVSREIANQSQLSFDGLFGGKPVSAGPRKLKLLPHSWTRLGSLDVRFAPSLPGESTADDGSGKPVARLTGRSISEPFFATNSFLRFRVACRGSDSEVRLVDLYDGNTVNTVKVKSGSRSMRFDMRPYNGHRMRIELIDRSESGWIQLRDLRLSS